MSKDSSEIDRDVAEKVMGWHRRACPTGEEWCSRDSVGNSQRQVNAVTWSPSTRIDHAWEVVEKMKEGWEAFTVSCLGADEWWAAFGELGEEREGYGEAETAPLAICRAALQAVKDQPQ